MTRFILPILTFVLLHQVSSENIKCYFCDLVNCSDPTNIVECPPADIGCMTARYLLRDIASDTSSFPITARGCQSRTDLPDAPEGTILDGIEVVVCEGAFCNNEEIDPLPTTTTNSGMTIIDERVSSKSNKLVITYSKNNSELENHIFKLMGYKIRI